MYKLVLRNANIMPKYPINLETVQLYNGSALLLLFPCIQRFTFISSCIIFITNACMWELRRKTANCIFKVQFPKFHFKFPFSSSSNCFEFFFIHSFVVVAVVSEWLTHNYKKTSLPQCFLSVLFDIKQKQIATILNFKWETF